MNLKVPFLQVTAGFHPGGHLAALRVVVRKNVRLDIQHRGAINQIHPFEEQAILIDLLKLAEGEADIIGTVGTATTENSHFDIIFFARWEDFALDLLVGIFVKDENDPDVGELLEVV